MKWIDIVSEYNKLQDKYGDKSLDAVISGGKMKNPKICFIFMNPTGRNITSSKEWTGIKSPWIGTKNVWKLFYKAGLFSKSLYEEIRSMKPNEWDEEFSQEVYKEVEKNDFYITNLAKCTQLDARKLPDKVFKQYLDLLYEELKIVYPEKIVTFGNQVSSIFLERPISVSKNRREVFKKKIGDKIISTLPIYYPVGQGMRNIDKAVSDIVWFCEMVQTLQGTFS